jgi:hypothetical protein
MPDETETDVTTVVQRATARYQAAPAVPLVVVILSAVIGAALLLTAVWADLIWPALHPDVGGGWSWQRTAIWVAVGLALLAPQQLYGLLHAAVPFFGRGKSNE